MKLLILVTVLLAIACSGIAAAILYKRHCDEASSIKNKIEADDADTFYDGRSYSVTKFIDSYYSEIALRVKANKTHGGGLMFAIGSPATIANPKSRFCMMMLTYRGGILVNRNGDTGLTALFYEKNDVDGGVDLMDNKWHDVVLKRAKHSISLLVDGQVVQEKRYPDEAIEETQLFIGGKPFEDARDGIIKFRGHIKNVVLNGVEAELVRIKFVGKK